MLKQHGESLLSTLALAAALFHIVNHGVFKSLLFAGAGSVLYATGSKNMNELGGLHKKLKLSAFFMFIGTAAISAIPPLNGFASEILIFKSFIEAGTVIASSGIILIIFFNGILLAVTSGGVLWASVKSYGLTFLGAPRSEKAVKTHPIPASMNAGMAVLAAYIVLLGVLSPIVLRWIFTQASALTGFSGILPANALSYEITVVSLLLLIVGIFIYFLRRSTGKNKVTERFETWACGFNEVKAYMQYSPSGFSQPATKFAGKLVRYKKESVIKEQIFLKQKVADLIEDNLYSRVIRFFDFLAAKIIKIHYGKIQIYVAYIFFSLLIAIILVMEFV